MWKVIQDQVLGMKWLNALIAQGLSAAGIDVQGKFGASVNFFLYDTVKITVLLCALIFSISFVQSYFPPERSRRIMGRFRGLAANVIAALLGTVTPFCSCSSIPIFMGFTSAGLPLGVTFSFLISSPMVDLGSLVLLTGVFGAKTALAYVILGLAVAIAGGSLICPMVILLATYGWRLATGSAVRPNPSISITCLGQPSAHLPQAVQRAGSTWATFPVTVTAADSQAFTHFMQPMQPTLHSFMVSTPLSWFLHSTAALTLFFGISSISFLGQVATHMPQARHSS